jgi:hypothetical protein
MVLVLSGCYLSQYGRKSLMKMDDPSFRELMPFQTGFEKALYKASLEVNSREFSGLMMIKESGDGNFKVAFFSELGLNFFDFELRDMGGNNHLNLYVRNIYEPLDRDMLLNKFEKYFSMLLGAGPAGPEVKTYLHSNEAGIMLMIDSYKGKDGYISTNLMEPYKEIVNVGGLFKKDKITISIPPDRRNKLPESILIEQPGFRLLFSLGLVE